MYTPWCDEAGKIIDDGTVARLGEDRFRLTSADPSWLWFTDCGYGLDARVKQLRRKAPLVKGSASYGPPKPLGKGSPYR